MPEALTPVEVFCCYSHADETWLRRLEIHLSLLKRQGLISLWHDRLIPPGTNQTVAANPIDLNSAPSLLQRSSFLYREVDRETDLLKLSIHWIIQQVLQDGMDPSTQRLWAERAVQAVTQALPAVESQVMQAHVR